MAKTLLTFKIYGAEEESVKARLQCLPQGYCSYQSFTMHLDTTLKVECDAKIEANIYHAVYSAFNGAVYADSDITLAEAVIDRLKMYGKKLAVAESLTGGLICDKLVAVPGCSEVFIEGLVTYSNESKVKRLGVDAMAIKESGAVSAIVATQMAEGVMKCGADYGIATTGIAGPGGGTEKKPVGLVYIGISDEFGTDATEWNFDGNRDAVRNISANTALFLLWKKLLRPLDFDSMVIE